MREVPDQETVGEWDFAGDPVAFPAGGRGRGDIGRVVDAHVDLRVYDLGETCGLGVREGEVLDGAVGGVGCLGFG